MEIKTKFDIGQEIWTVEREKTTVRAPCPYCDDGKIKTKVGMIECPKCDGDGDTAKREAGKFIVESMSTVRAIKVVVLPGMYEVDYETSARWRLFNEAKDRLFPTREEAKAEAERLNDELKN